MMDRKHINYLRSRLGKQWVLGAQGPDSFDCWSLVVDAKKHLFERDLPAIEPSSDRLLYLARFIAKHPERRHMNPLDKPVHGCIVEMSHGNHPHHIGIHLDVDGGGIFHCAEGIGVCFDRVDCLKVAGWRRFLYYEWV